ECDPAADLLRRAHRNGAVRARACADPAPELRRRSEAAEDPADLARMLDGIGLGRGDSALAQKQGQRILVLGALEQLPAWKERAAAELAAQPHEPGDVAVVRRDDE